MKLKHNKKRNVGFIYEVLIKQLSKASMQKSEEKKQKVIKILKTLFQKCAAERGIKYISVFWRYKSAWWKDSSKNNFWSEAPSFYVEP